MSTSLMMPESINPKQNSLAVVQHISAAADSTLPQAVPVASEALKTVPAQIDHSLAEAYIAALCTRKPGTPKFDLAQFQTMEIEKAALDKKKVKNVAVNKKTTASKRWSECKQVPLDQIRAGRSQPRQAFDAEALADLTQSVRTHGILQPLLVRPVTAGPAQHEPAHYEIIAGERRWRAGQEAGLTQVPILVQNLSDEAAAEVSLVENLQRENLTPLEVAQALVQLTAQGYSVRKLAARLGKQKGWVEQHLLLARLPEDLQAMVSGRPDTLTHARELEKVTDLVLRADLITQVLDRDNPLPLARLRQLLKAANTDVPQSDMLQQVLAETRSANDETASADDENSDDENSDDESHNALPKEPALEEHTLLREADTEADMEPEADTSVEILLDSVLHQEGLLANLRTTQKRLPHLPAPADPARRQELIAMLAATRDAIALTLARWGAQA